MAGIVSSLHVPSSTDPSPPVVDGVSMWMGLVRGTRPSFERTSAFRSETDIHDDANHELRNLRLLSEHCGDVFATVGPDMRFRYVSPSVTRILGWPIESAIGRAVTDFVVDEDVPTIGAATSQLRAGLIRSAIVTVRVRHQDGTIVWAEITSRPIGEPGSADLGERAVVIRDVTERKALQDALTSMAMKDGLTGLANRRAFDIALGDAWSKVRASRSQMSLLLIDVDFFKEFNDAYGHQTGDDCLLAISTALLGLPLAVGDVVARYGGEELAVILHRSGAAEAVKMAGLACDAVHRLQLPHRRPPTADGILTISVGAATVLWREGGSSNMPHALIASADRALYQAKSNGRNRVSTGLVLGASA